MKMDVMAAYSTVASASSVVRWRADSMAHSSAAMADGALPRVGELEKIMRRRVAGRRRRSPCVRGRLGADLVQERPGVERVEREAPGDLLARRLRPLAKEVDQQLARPRVAPPVFADFGDEVGPELRRPDP